MIYGMTMIESSRIVIFHLLFNIVNTEIVNVALRKQSWQSSTESTWIAARANDGNYANSPYMEKNSCSHTGSNKTKTWWQVDLGQSYTIERIILTTRNWNDGYKRLANFTVYVSQHNKTNGWTNEEQCYHDESPHSEAANNRTINCSHNINGRYIVIYNERSQQISPDFSPTAILELCEVNVPIEENCGDINCHDCRIGWYGKRCEHPCGNCGGRSGCYKINGNCIDNYCSPGFYGNACDKSCSSQCVSNTCHSTNGFCDECASNTYGAACETPCPTNCDKCLSPEMCTTCSPGWYGTTCMLNCSNCGGNNQCSQTFGECDSRSCTTGYYGAKCTLHCSLDCTEDGSCNFTSGFCNHCLDRKYGKRCENNCADECKSCDMQGKCLQCETGFYGADCRKRCPGCGGDGSCIKSNGLCNSGNCRPGYYGSNGLCNRNCSSNCGGDTSCNKSTGACLYECKNGWYDQHCNVECSANCETNSCNKIDGACRIGCAKRFHGLQCTQDCPVNCGGDGACDKESGICSNGCRQGWNGTECNAECVFPKFGNECTEDCGHCRNNSCHHINGTCMQGCETGWLSSQCVIRASKKADNSGDVSTGVVGGAIGAVALLIIIAVVAVLLIRRSRGNSKRSEPPDNKGYMYRTEQDQAIQNATYTNIISIEEEKRTSRPKVLSPKPVFTQSGTSKNADESDRTYYNSIDIKMGVAVTELKAYVTDKLSSNKFEEEFEGIPYGAIHLTTAAEMPKNMKKNRFKTTFPYDHSRVVLKGKTDYINANFIEDTDGIKRYIATQGPIPNTIEDFWQMVWEYNIDIIVMLTNLQEGKKKKCEQYWPNPNEKMTQGQFGLSLLDERQFSYYVLRELEVHDLKSKQRRKIEQYHFTTWPDHGTPDPLFLVLFHKRVISTAPKYDGPILVHCSAGIGRTGTFIALDALENQGKKYGKVDVENYVRIMRKDRMNMIQTSEQYKVLHEALIEAFRWKDTFISMGDFPSVWQKIESDKGPLNQQYLKKEYDMLREMKSDQENPVSALREENIAKSRTDSILPMDKHRPYLSSYFSGGNDFINSVMIPSHISKDAFLVTQVPLPGTVVDFWRMIVDHDSRSIVYFASLSEDGTNFYPYHEDIVETEMHIIRKQSSNILQEGVEEIKIQVKNKRSSQTKDVVMLKIDIADNNYPSGAQIFRAAEVVELQRNRNKNCPCTVVALDGCTPCEVFCAISNILEYMKVDNRIDVFQTARQLQIRRPEFFGTFETYRYCYQIINEYLITQSVYFNM